MDDESINANNSPPEVMAKEKFSIFVKFHNDLEEDDEILDHQVH